MYEYFDSSDLLYTRREVSRILGLNEGTLAVWACKKKKLPYIKIGRSVRYRREDVAEFIKKNTKDCDDEAPQ